MSNRRTIQRHDLVVALEALMEQLGVDSDSVHSLTVRPTHLLLHTITERDVTERIDIVGPPTIARD